MSTSTSPTLILALLVSLLAYSSSPTHAISVPRLRTSNRIASDVHTDLNPISPMAVSSLQSVSLHEDITTTPSPDAMGLNEDNGNGSGDGRPNATRIGPAVAVVLVLAIAGGIAYYYWRRRRQQVFVEAVMTDGQTGQSNFNDQF